MSEVNFTPTSIAFLLLDPGLRGCAVEVQIEHGQMVTVKDADCVAPFRDAVTVTCDSPLGSVLSVVSVKLPVDDEAGTVTEAGTVSTGLLLESDKVTPPLGAAAERVTVQVLLDPALRLAGVQAKLVTVTRGKRLRLKVLEVPFNEAVTVAL